MLERIRDLFQKKETPPIPTGEIGFESSMLYGMADFGKYNPDILQSRKGLDLYDRMMTDDQVKPVIQFKQHAVLSRKYYFDVEMDENGEPKEGHEDMARFFNFLVKSVNGSFLDNLVGILSALPKGFSVTEKVFSPVEWEGRQMWGLKDLKLRPHATFNGGFIVDAHGNLKEVYQNVAGKSVKLPVTKIIHFVHQPDQDRHYGFSDLRAAYRAWWSKDIISKFRNIHLERHAGGFVWAKVEGKLDNTQKANLQNMLKNISARMGAHVPSNVNLEVIQPLKTDAFEKAIAQENLAIAKSILVPNLLGLSEQTAHGSFAQSETQLHAFFWILDAIANRLEETLNEQLFRDLAFWNFGTEDYPLFQFEPMTDEMKGELAATWNELVKGGAVTRTDADENHIRKLLDFPEKPIEKDEPAIEEPIGPEEMPDNQDWIDAQPNREFILKEFQEKPWLKRVNFARIGRMLDNNDAKFVNSLTGLMAKAKIDLEKQITRIVGKRSLREISAKEFEGIYIPSSIMSGMRRIIRTNLRTSMNDGYEIARKELPKKQQAIAPGMDRTQIERYIDVKAKGIAGVIEKDVLAAVSQVIENGIKYDKTLRDTILAISEETTLISVLPEVDSAGRAINIPARLENIVRTNTSDALNQARQSLFGSAEFRGFVQAFEYSAVLDDRTTEICEHLTGKILKDFGNYTPPNHFQCRSILVPVTLVDDWDGKESARPRLQPQKGFG